MLVFEKHKATHPLAHYTGILTLQGLARWSVTSGDQSLLARAREELLPFIRGERPFKCNFPNYLCGGNGTAYLFFQGQLPEARDVVRSNAEQILTQAPRTHDGIITMPGSAGGDKIWIDAVFAVVPFLACAGLALNEARYIDEAVRQVRKHVAVLRDPSNGLLHQARGFSGPGVISADHWSRGNGWGLLALTELVDVLPANHPHRAEVVQIYLDLLEACLRFQDPDGLWHQEITLASSYVETSGTGLILHALGVALKHRLVPAARQADFDRGIRGLLTYVEADGSVRNACEGCLSPGDGSIAQYLTRQPVRNDPHSFGPVLLALGDALSLQKSNP